MNLQEAFNKIWAHAQKKERSSNGLTSQCLYRGPNNTKCFVGVLIPDDNYQPIMDDNTLSSVLAMLPEVFDDISSPALASLQRIHDNIDPDDWNNHLRAFATRYKLTVPGEN